MRRSQKPLSPQEMRDLRLMLQEAKSRGIKLPKEAQELLADKKKAVWPIAPNGYFLRDDGILYNPSVNHEGFIKSRARYVLLYGPRGCGKSGAGAQKAVFKISQGESGIISNPDFENLKLSTWPEFKRWIPWKMVIPQHRHRHSDAWQPTQPFTMAFMNGAIVRFKGGKESSSSRGPNVNWFWYDEGGRDETGLAWQVTSAGVRVGKDPQSWCTMTPKPTEHWAYKFFVEQNIPDELIQEFDKASGGDRILIEYFHATREDNATNLDATYYASLSLLNPTGWMRAQEYDGEFANEGGRLASHTWFIGGKDSELEGSTAKEHPNRVLDARPERVAKRVRFWDLAATEKKVVGIGKKKEMNDPDESVGTLISKFKNELHPKDQFCIEDQVGGFWSWENLLDNVVNTARHDGPYVTVVLEEEPGSGGKNQVAAVQMHFKKFPELKSIKVVGQKAKEVGDRVMAANHWFAVAAEGRMWMVRGKWNQKFLGQLDGFTQVAHDDRVTSVTGGMNYLSPFASWVQMPFVTL